jgi:hypothetical protein
VPGGSAFSGPEPAFISVEGGIPPLSTGAPLLPANVTTALSDNKVATVIAVSFDLFMVHSFQGCWTASAGFARAILASYIRIIR